MDSDWEKGMDWDREQGMARDWKKRWARFATKCWCCERNTVEFWGTKASSTNPSTETLVLAAMPVVTSVPPLPSWTHNRELLLPLYEYVFPVGRV